MFISGWPVTKRLYLMQGVPGSGKSTLAETMRRSYAEKEVAVVVFSTDDWRFKDGKYEYDPETNKAFHQACQKAVIGAMQGGIEAIIVDNTNITQWQADPYLAMARIFDYEVMIVRVEVDVKVAIARQENRPVDRQIPAFVIEQMNETMERLVV